MSHYIVPVLIEGPTPETSIRVTAIRFYRAATGASLREGVDAVGHRAGSLSMTLVVDDAGLGRVLYLAREYEGDTNPHLPRVRVGRVERLLGDLIVAGGAVTVQS